MPRILGIDIPNEKRIEISLTYIYGIGLSRSQMILEEAGIDSNIRAKDLSDEQIGKVINAIAVSSSKTSSASKRSIVTVVSVIKEGYRYVVNGLNQTHVPGRDHVRQLVSKGIRTQRRARYNL